VRARHRLNPGGNREAGHALWRIMITPMSSHAPTRAYVERRTEQGLRGIVIPPPRRDRPYRPHWSTWRRRHQHRARQARQRWNAYAETTP
jgi:hypothetical protein